MPITSRGGTPKKKSAAATNGTQLDLNGGDHSSKKSNRSNAAVIQIFLRSLLVIGGGLLFYSVARKSNPTTTSSIDDWSLFSSSRSAHESKICNSLYRTGGNDRWEIAHSPLIFPRDDLMVCRTAKVGTNELRCIQRSYDKGEKFKYAGNGACRPKDRNMLAELQQVKKEDTFKRYLYGDDVDRIMFVRHPVRRILSGFIQIASTEGVQFWRQYQTEKDIGFGPDAFKKWITRSTFRFEYDPHCSASSHSFSMDFYYQHWAPPQHCRCGLWDCGVEWKIFKVEEIESVAAKVAEYIPGPWIPAARPPGKKAIHSKANKYNLTDYFTPDVLDLLNEMTQIERDYFGYEPLVV